MSSDGYSGQPPPSSLGGESGGGSSGTGGDTNNSSNSLGIPGSAQAYANRAASAIKASGAFARLGKALYGGGGNTSGGGTSTTASSASSLPASPSYYSSFADAMGSGGGSGLHNVIRGGALSAGSTSAESAVSLDDDDESTVDDQSYGKYTARGGIVAMAPSPDRNSVAIVGKDFFQILTVSNLSPISSNETVVTLAHNVRGVSGGSRDFDKIYVATALKWGSHMHRKYLAMSNSGGRIFLYNIEKPEGSRPTVQLIDSNRSVNSIAFNPHNGYNLLSGSSDGTVRLWDLRENNNNKNARNSALTFSKAGDSAREVQFSPLDPKKFAVIYDSGIIQRWDIRQPLNYDRRINAHSGVGLSIDWHPEKDYIASGGRDQQIQVWNMSTESRNPDYVISAPSPVAKVRWLVDSNDMSSPPSFSKDIINSQIASCGRGKGDYKMYVWDLKRPYIPLHIIEQHTDAITDICYRRDRLLWTVSKDKTFRQHNLNLEPFAISNLSARAFAWSASNDILFVAQNKERLGFIPELADPTILATSNSSDHLISNSSSTAAARRSSTTAASIMEVGSPNSIPGVSGSGGGRRSGSSHHKPKTHLDAINSPVLCNAVFPGNEPGVFSFCAKNYRLFPREGETLVDICKHNSHVAVKAGRLRTSKVWAILVESILDEMNRYVVEAKKRRVRPSYSNPLNSAFQPYNLQNRKQKSEQDPVQQPKQEYKIDSASDGGMAIRKIPSRGESVLNAATTDMSPAAANASTIEPMNIPEVGTQLSSKSNTGGAASISHPPVLSVNSTHRSSFDTIPGSSPEESYGALRDSISAGPGGGGTSYTHISMLGTSSGRIGGRAYSTSTHLSSGTEGGTDGGTSSSLASNTAASEDNSTVDLIGKSIAEWRSRTLDDIKEDVSDNSVSTSSVTGVAISGMGAGAGAGIASSPAMIPSLLSQGTNSSSDGKLTFASDPKLVLPSDGLSTSSSSKLSAALHRKMSRMSLDSTGGTTAHGTTSTSTGAMGNSGNTGTSLSRHVSTQSSSTNSTSSFTFRQFIELQTSPWRTEVLVAKATEYAMEQGDVQLCAVLAAIFRFDYVRIVKSQRVAEEWIMSYIQLLVRQQLFTAAAGLRKISKFKSIRKLGNTDTNLDMLCHRCMAPLSDNVTLAKERLARTQEETDDFEFNDNDDPKYVDLDPDQIGFWYCETCRKLLDGCSICRGPVKGLALIMLECGHKAHIDCLKDWVFEEGMVECPTGCGSLIVK